MNIFRNRLGYSSGSQTGTVVYIDGVKSRASRVDLDEVIPMPYIQSTIDAYEPQCVVFNDEIHLIGGNYDHYRSHIKWNGTEWETVSSLPDDIGGVAYADEDYIYILCANSGNHYIHTWDGTQWTQRSGAITASNAKMVKYNNEIYVLSGTMFAKHNGSYWSRLTDAPYNSQTSTIVVYNNAIHMLGGTTQPTSHYQWNGSAWVRVSTIPVNCTNGCSLVYEDKLHLFFNDTAKIPYHYIWDGNSWSEGIKPLSEHGTQGVVFNNKIMLSGHLYSNFIEPLNCVKNITITA